ncbi:MULTISPECIES: DUF5655 domain-containing protein [unclassified Treponema]|uniref:DUF5655 domain-containing protein n=1 Tax=unclassified Treponema TaxID=2638727 RepID=UPI0020A5EF57|nr:MULTISPECIES: DUF5655 domain-containing protein [unclassified Treponema]UTC66820.1 hypothetical protein E4O06_12890 [Treponema sp. OMZ 789]UTC69552.1 hypothetical protein E4O01_13025 [Treponema sp. OMZ 790]UTC72265.1 hypothetical protein E4O02_13120 [Treponema sp. OMZ 791]
MALFNLENEKLNYIKEEPFKLEKEIQNLCEKNMQELLHCEFIKTEFVIENFCIDSLGFDKTTSSFVIIEYKRDKNFSVIDQGYAYLSLMLNHKSDFILEYNETTGKNLKRNDIDWTQSKVVFIAPSFTTYQREAIAFKDLPIELYEIKKYANKTISFTQIITKNAAESIKTISKSNEELEAVNKEIKVYTEWEKIEFGSQSIQELYEKLKTMILNIGDDISIKPKKLYIAFLRKTNFCDINIQKNQIKIWLNVSKGNISDSKGILRDVSNIGHHGNGDYELNIDSDSDIEYIVSLIRQSYNLCE